VWAAAAARHLVLQVHPARGVTAVSCNTLCCTHVTSQHALRHICHAFGWKQTAEMLACMQLHSL
jgi:hypothetical protein